MTIHGAGTPIYASEIQAEFGGGNPFYISNYYAGGPYVPAGTTGIWGAIPASGAISLGHFYGATKNRLFTFGSYGVSSGFMEGGFGSITPNPGGPAYPFGASRIIAFYNTGGQTYLDVADSWAKNAFNNVDLPGIVGYNSASANLYVIQGGYTRWRWAHGNYFTPDGRVTPINFT